MDSYDLTELLLTKGFEDLRPSERSFVLQTLNDKDEYDSFRKITLESKDEVKSDSKSKAFVMAAFDEHFKGAERSMIIESPKSDDRKLIYWLAAAASLAVLITLGTFLLIPNEDFHLAENNRSEQKELILEDTIENSTTELSDKPNEITDLNESDSEESLSKDLEQSSPPTPAVIDIADEYEADSDGADEEIEAPEYVISEAEIVEDDLALEEVSINSEKKDEYAAYRSQDIEVAADEILQTSDSSSPAQMAQISSTDYKSTSTRSGADVVLDNESSVKRSKSKSYIFKLKRINKDHYVSY